VEKIQGGVAYGKQAATDQVVNTAAKRVSGLCVCSEGRLEHEALEVDGGLGLGGAKGRLTLAKPWDTSGTNEGKGSSRHAIAARVIYAGPARKPARLQGRDGNARGVFTDHWTSGQRQRVMKGLSQCVVTDEDGARDYGACKSWRMAQTHVRQTVVANSRRVRLAVAAGGRWLRSVCGGEGQRGTLSGEWHVVARGVGGGFEDGEVGVVQVGMISLCTWRLGAAAATRACGEGSKVHSALRPCRPC
jgi:hypothetical protein